MIDVALASAIAASLAAVRSRLERAAVRSGRDPSSIRLVAVSKTFGPDHVRAAFAAGQVDFGENRVQEGLAKAAQVADLPITWHLVGHLQSNKVRRAVGPFAWVHSVDSPELVRRIEAVATERASRVPVLVQVDLAGEATKYGAPEDGLDSIFEAAAQCRFTAVVGLMLLPPYFEDPEATRPWFRRLRALRDEWRGRGVPEAWLEELSMGMSHDFEVAIEEGATIVRVGTAIFGRRPAAAAARPAFATGDDR